MSVTTRTTIRNIHHTPTRPSSFRPPPTTDLAQQGVEPNHGPIHVTESHTTIVHPPRPPLVGVELNPGPPRRSPHTTHTKHSKPTPLTNGVKSTVRHTSKSTTSAVTSLKVLPKLIPSMAQALFVDGVLSIFGFLSFSDLLPAIHSCHYWLSCSLRERSRHLTCKMKSSTPTRPFNQPQFSALAHHHISSLTNFSIYDLTHLTHFTHLTNLTLRLDQLNCISSTNASANVRKWLPNIRLPNSVTFLTIESSMKFRVSEDIVRSLVNLLSKNAPTNLMCLKHTAMHDHEYELSQLLQIRSLTDVTLISAAELSKQSHGICARRRLKRCHLKFSRIDLTIFHSQSRFMLSIEDWNWFNWTPTMDEWDELIQHPPPNLHILHVCVGRESSLHGLSSLNLTSLELNLRSWPSESDIHVPALLSCHTLTYLSIPGLGFLDQHLTQLLKALAQLLSISYRMDMRSKECLRLLPSHTIVPQCHSFVSFESFASNLIHSDRLERLDIEHLKDFPPWPISRLRSELVQFKSQLDQLKTPLREMNIQIINGIWIDFRYSRSIDCTPPCVESIPGTIVPGVISDSTHSTVTPHTAAAAPKQDPSFRPAPPTDLTQEGVEPNPGPSGLAQTLFVMRPGDEMESQSLTMHHATVTNHPPFLPTPSAQTLFVDGVLSIFGFLSVCDLIPALHSCHYWYSCGLKEKPRQLTLDMKSRMGVCYSNVLMSPLRFHFGMITNLSIYQWDLCHSFTHIHTIHVLFDADVPMSPTYPSTGVFLLPSSLTAITIIGSYDPLDHAPVPLAPVELCQRFIASLVTGQKLAKFEWHRTTLDHQFDLSPIVKIPSLTHLHLYRPTLIERPVDLNLWAQLPLKIFFISSNEVDLAVYHPQSPFMLNIESWGWWQWKPAADDWHHLSQHPPPKLRALTMLTDDDHLPVGLPSLQLSSLALNLGAYTVKYIPYVCACKTLKRLTLNGWTSINEQHLIEQILRALDQLNHFELHGSTCQLTTCLQYLPRRTILSYIELDSFESFRDNLIQSTRVEKIELAGLDIRKNGRTNKGGFNRTVDLIRMCQSMTQLKEMRIRQLNETDQEFIYIQSINLCMPLLSSNRPLSLGQTLFMDGVLSIVSYLSFADALPGLHTCHHWYSCGLKERSRSLTLNMVSVSKNPLADSLWTSPHRFHITTLINLSVLDAHLIPLFPQIHTCSFSAASPAILFNSDVMGPAQQQLTHLPGSLTSCSLLTMSMNNLTIAHQKACQRLISLLPTGPLLKRLEVIFPLTYPLDLSPLKEMPSLTDLHLSVRYQYRPAAQTLCAGLALKKLEFNGLTGVNFNQFHPLSKLMSTIEEWDWTDWKPSEEDWKHISTSPPPHLRTLKMIYDPDHPMYGLSALNLTHLTLVMGGSSDIDYLPHLTQCRSLTYLCMSDVMRLEDHDLCLILQSLIQLDQFKLLNSRPVQLSHSLQLLPRHTSINDLQIDSLNELTKYLIPSVRMEVVIIRHLDGLVGRPIPSFGRDDLIQVCQSIPQLLQLRIGILNQRKMQFIYHKAIHAPSKEVPPARLVGIETNPGPTNIIPVSLTPQTIFKDALHIIYSYLTLSEWLSSMYTCHHWYAAGCSQPNRELSWSYRAVRSTVSSISTSIAAGIDAPKKVMSLGHFSRFDLHSHFSHAIQSDHPTTHYITGDQLLHAIQPFINLTRLEARLDQDVTNELICHLPSGLTDLTISFKHGPFPHILTSLTQQLSHQLQSLTLYQFDPYHLPASLTILPHVHHLTYLVIHCDGYDEMNESEREPIHHIWSQLTPSLTHLDARGWYVTMYQIHELPTLPQLVYLHICSLEENDLDHLVNISPHVQQLTPTGPFHVNHLSLFKSFQSLHTVHFRSRPTNYPMDDDLTYMVTHLSQCHSLTTLKFDMWIHFTTENWLQLSHALPILIKLQLQQATDDSLLSLSQCLSPETFMCLESLVILDRYSVVLKDKLNDRRICPKLTTFFMGVVFGQTFQFEVDKKINIDCYRLSIETTDSETVTHVPYGDPPIDLTQQGIEPNPEPSTTASLNSNIHDQCMHA